jgi:hypothetical protein
MNYSTFSLLLGLAILVLATVFHIAQAKRPAMLVCSIGLLSLACLHLVNVVPLFAIVATEWLSLRSEVGTSSQPFPEANLGFAFLCGVSGVCALLWTIMEVGSNDKSSE